MSLFNVLGGIAGYMLRNVTEPSDPDKVLEVRVEKYVKHPVVCREEGMVLYGPVPTRDSEGPGLFEIVLNQPCTSSLNRGYSLHRSRKQDESELRFCQLKDKIPILMEISRECCTAQMLQKICTVLHKNPSWTITHIVAYFGLQDNLKHIKVSCHLNTPDAMAGVTPLMVAVQEGNFRMVQALLSAQADPNMLDKGGNSVYHYAATSSKEILQLVINSNCKFVDQRNVDGYTPLHLACLEDKPDCVNALLYAGADFNVSAGNLVASSGGLQSAALGPGCLKDVVNPNQLHSQEMKYGGTPLHWAKSRQVIESLLDVGCNIDARNFEGKTALYVMVARNRLPCVIELLSHGASLSCADKDGNTPLHHAALSGSVPILQALIGFGAELEAKNNDGLTARHIVATTNNHSSNTALYVLHAVGALRCLPRPNSKCNDGCNPGGTFDGICPDTKLLPRCREILDETLQMISAQSAWKNGTSARQPNDHRHPATKGGRLLCIDGGGIKGLASIQVLMELERAARKPIIHMFDWLAGTSTGGILALSLATGKSTHELLQLYFRLKEKTFTGSRPYDIEPLENFLKKELGAETVMADIKNPKVMVTGVLADRHPADLHIFRSYRSPQEILGLNEDQTFSAPPSPAEQLVWRAARASGAAPTYFRASGRFIDGGLIANNPTLDALTEIHEYNTALRAAGSADQAVDVSLVVSIGTGKIPISQVSAIDVFRPENPIDTLRLAFGVSALGTLLIDQATANDGRVVDRARAWCSQIGVPFFRLTPPLTVDIQLDEKNDEVLVNMVWETKAYMHSKRTELVRLVTLLTL